MSANEPLIPAQLTYATNGTPYSEVFDDIYHSTDGGLGQARHVFLAGNDLPQHWQEKDDYCILETGFGLGLNFLATWAAWQADPRRPKRLDYISVEKHPFSAQDLTSLHRQWPEFAELSQALSDQWPCLVPGFHRIYLAGDAICLTLLFGDAQTLLRKLEAKVDAIYLDGFAPDKNPDLWSPPVLKALARLAKHEATLATYTVASSVRSGLNAVGFITEKRPGYARKREMLCARFAPKHPHTQISNKPKTHSAIVIGAGLAGCAISERLAARGWRVTVIERHSEPAQEASGNLAGIVRPMMSLDDNIASRLSRACFLFAIRHWLKLQTEGLPLKWFDQGILQLARDPRHEQLQQEILTRRQFPGNFAQFLDAEAASSLLNWPVPLGGWLFPHAGHANPASLCQAYLQRFPEHIEHRFAREAMALHRTDGGWQVQDAHTAIAEAETVIIACGAEARHFSQTQALPIRRIRGQVSHIAEGQMPSLPMALTREGYATPALDGWHCAGASYELEENWALSSASAAGNLGRLDQMLPGVTQGMDAATLSGRVALRAVAPDRLPLVGALPDLALAPDTDQLRLANVRRLPGLYGLLGYGSRGLVWHTLAAELLAAQIADEPLPLEKDLIDAIDPARFQLRAKRREQA